MCTDAHRCAGYAIAAHPCTPAESPASRSPLIASLDYKEVVANGCRQDDPGHVPHFPRPAGFQAPSGLRKVVAASMAGTIVEWYEFFLYATAATLVFNVIFFPPSDNPLDNIIKAFLTYAVGFIARPLGGIVFGHFGDKYGRKKLLQLAIILVGVSTFLMGCLPTFDQIGYAAPILLIVLRFFQGFAVGGEWGGAVLLVAEHSPDKQRGFWASWPQAAVPAGNLLATVVLLTLSRTLTEEQFLSWGWRIGFWLSVVIVAVGYYIRTKVTDAPIFIEAQKEVEAAKKTELRRHRGAEALPARRLHRHGPPLRREHHVLPRGDVLDHLHVGAPRHGHVDDPHARALRTRRALLRDPGRRAVQRQARPQAGLRGRRRARRRLGLRGVPAVRHAERLAHRRRAHPRPRHPRAHVRQPAGDHGRDVPDAHALLGRLARLPGHVDRGGLARADHRDHAAVDLRQLGAGRDLPRARRGRDARRGHRPARDRGHLAPLDRRRGPRAARRGGRRPRHSSGCRGRRAPREPVVPRHPCARIVLRPDLVGREAGSGNIKAVSTAHSIPEPGGTA